MEAGGRGLFDTKGKGRLVTRQDQTQMSAVTLGVTPQQAKKLQKSVEMEIDRLENLKDAAGKNIFSADDITRCV